MGLPDGLYDDIEIGVSGDGDRDGSIEGKLDEEIEGSNVGDTTDNKVGLMKGSSNTGETVIGNAGEMVGTDDGMGDNNNGDTVLVDTADGSTLGNTEGLRVGLRDGD